MGVLSPKFKKKPLRDTKIQFCGCGLNCFSHLRGTYTCLEKHIIFCYNILAQYPKRCHKFKAHPLYTFWSWIPRGTKVTFLTPTKYEMHLILFISGSCPLWGERGKRKGWEKISPQASGTNIPPFQTYSHPLTFSNMHGVK